MTVVKSITLVNGFVQSGTAGTVDTADLTADAVTYAKIQNVTAGKLLGSVSGSAADPGEVTVGTGLSLSGGTLTATGGGGSGTVTSFSAGNLSPLFTTSVAPATTTPVLSFTAVNQSANLVYTGPASGAAAAPTFRALVTADYPDATVTYAKIQNITAGTLLGSISASAAAPGEVTVGTGLALSAGVLSAISKTLGIWRFDTTTTMSAPGSGHVRFNNATVTAATAIAIHATTDAGTDASNLLKTLTTGDGIYIQDQGNSANWVRYDITGAVTNNTTWFQIPVAIHTATSSGGSLPTNNTPLAVQFTTGGSGGGGGTVTSVGLSLPGEFTVTGSPVTGAGTLAAAWAAQAIYKVLCTTGTTPSFQTLLAGHLQGAVFNAAGTGHTAGAVPDPGSTAHSNVPRLLADTAAFVLPGGKTLGFLATGTDQSTSLTTATDLATKDEVTFSADEDVTVNILWSTGIYHDTAGKNAHDDIVVDNGSGYGASIFGTDYYLANALGGATLTMLYQYAFTGTGTRKVKVMHSNVNGGGNCHWRSRTLLVWVA